MGLTPNGLSPNGLTPNFGGLEAGEAGEGKGKGKGKTGKTPRFSVVSVPYDLTTTYVSGASSGPGAIIEASANMELYDEELKGEPWKAGIETLAPLEVTELRPEDMVDRVRAASAGIIESGSMPVL
ncbi:MAG: arginase family protein, partial [Thermodesulfobacteriota bacterium]